MWMAVRGLGELDERLIERLGETVRARVKAHSGIELQWEIVRLGLPLPGRATGEALVERTA